MLDTTFVEHGVTPGGLGVRSVMIVRGLAFRRVSGADSWTGNPYSAELAFEAEMLDEMAVWLRTLYVASWLAFNLRSLKPRSIVLCANKPCLRAISGRKRLSQEVPGVARARKQRLR
jgi:hypothetical protein